MKTCPRCKLPKEHFNSQGKCCLECHAARNRAWRANNIEKDREAKRKWARKAGPVARKRQKKSARKCYLKHRDRYIKTKKERNDAYFIECQKYLIEYLRSHPCVDCGESHILRLSFDHVRGSKNFNIGEIRTRAVTPKRLVTEVAKCDVRCMNCHAEKTARHGKHWKVKYCN